MIQRRTPLKRGGYTKRRTRVSRVSKKRREERADYSAQKAVYLAAHPLDQIFIAVNGINESDALAHFRLDDSTRFAGLDIPRANQIHHRNKGYGARLLDERWWMATSPRSHNHVEDHKGWAREEGYLLPIQADAEGRWGSGNQGLTTPELMKQKAAR